MTTPPKRILLVDDDQALAEFMKFVFQFEGYEVELAADGEQAQQAVLAAPFAAIVLDMMMPVLDGKRFLKWLRQERADATPVIVLTAVTTAQVHEELQALGVDAIFVKPVTDFGSLLNRLRALLA